MSVILLPSYACQVVVPHHTPLIGVRKITCPFSLRSDVWHERFSRKPNFPHAYHHVFCKLFLASLCLLKSAQRGKPFPLDRFAIWHCQLTAQQVAWPSASFRKLKFSDMN